MKYAWIILAVIAAGAGFMAIKNNQVPDDVGMKNGAFAPLDEKPHGVSTQADDPEKQVAPLPFSGDLQNTKALFLKACDAYGTYKVAEEKPNYMHLIFTTGTMKYKDDVEVYFDTDAQQIEYRSQSRIGYSDMGLNRERYDVIAQKYEAYRR